MSQNFKSKALSVTEILETFEEGGIFAPLPC